MKKFIIALLLFVFFNLSEGFAQDENKILWSAGWSNDGESIAVGGDDGLLRIFDTKDFTLKSSFETNGQVKRLRWHPFKNLIAVAGTEAASGIYQYKNGEIVKLFDLKNLQGRSIDWNPAGNQLVFADYEGIVTIFDDTGEIEGEIKKIDSKSYTDVRWHPSEDEILILGEHITLMDTEGGMIAKFKQREQSVLLLASAWHPSGKFFVTADYGDFNHNYSPLIQFWEDDKKIFESNLSLAEFRNLEWNEKGNRLASVSDELRIWNRKGKLKHSGQSRTNLWGLDWSPDGNFLITTSADGEISIWDKKARIIKRWR